MGLHDARRRQQTAAASAQRVTSNWAEVYRATIAEVNPLLRRTAIALRHRVPEAAYRQRFEAERERAFQAHRSTHPRARRHDFVSKHSLDGVHAVAFSGDGPGGLTVWVDGGLSQYASSSLGLNLDSGAWSLDEHTTSDRIGESGPRVQCIMSSSYHYGDDRLTAFLLHCGTDGRKLIEVVENRVIDLIDYYGVPQSEVEG